MVRFNVFTDLETLTREEGVGELDNGALIPETTLQRLACDPVVRLIIRDQDRVVGIGRASRQIPGWLRDLVYQRDGYQCQFPGCTHTRWLQVHHIIPWSQGGTTDLDNLILLCGHHYRYLHQHHWQISGPPEHPTFHKPDHQPYPPPKPELHPRLVDLIQDLGANSPALHSGNDPQNPATRAAHD